MTAFLVAVTAVAAYCYFGASTAAIVLTTWTVVILVLLRLLVPSAVPSSPPQQETWQRHVRTSFIGFWRKRGAVSDATSSMPSYDLGLRGTLQHLLAARLAERHGVSLYADPHTARRLLLRGPRDEHLWFWLDPQRPAETRQDQPGIPVRTLAAILDRLERL